MWQHMYKADQLAVEVHSIPLSAEEAGEQRHRLRTLLVRGARRLAQLTGDHNQQAGSSEATEVFDFGLVQE